RDGRGARRISFGPTAASRRAASSAVSPDDGEPAMPAISGFAAVGMQDAEAVGMPGLSETLRPTEKRATRTGGRLQIANMPVRSPGPHFSMIRSFHLADLFTLANGALGAGAVLAFMRFLVDGTMAYFWLGTAFLPVAVVMDALDGRIARRRGVASPLGQE